MAIWPREKRRAILCYFEAGHQHSKAVKIHGLVFGQIHGESQSGWWARATPLKNMKVNWDDDSNPILMGKCQKWQPNHQPEVFTVDFPFNQSIESDNSKKHF